MHSVISASCESLHEHSRQRRGPSRYSKSAPTTKRDDRHFGQAKSPAPNSAAGATCAHAKW
ncbi:MAG: hypothetical protein CMJ58_01200 [Planctomycetaceae bacterium]|nr:hypothetical protein [Planctomycetaceae bacterium]